MLLSALILGLTGSNVLATEQTSQDRVLNEGWNNQVDGVYLVPAIINPSEKKLDNVMLTTKRSNNRYRDIGTIGEVKKMQLTHDQSEALRHITSNNAVFCGDTIILNSTDIRDCEECRILQFALLALQKKNNTTTN